VAELSSANNGGHRAGSELPIGEVLSYSVADWAASSARSGVIGILPLVVLAVVGPEGSAYYLVAWTITYSIYLLSANIGDALLAEVSYDEGNVERHTLHSGLLSMAISSPIVLVAIVAAPWVLRAFGTEYANESTTVLRLLLLGAIPNVVTRTYVGRLRAEGRMKAVIAYEVILSLAVLAAGWILLAAMGIVGLGVAWLVMLSFAAAYVLLIETLWWWAPRLGPRSVRWLVKCVRAARRLGRFRSSLLLARGVRRTLAEMYSSKPRWRRIGLTADSQVVSVAGHEGRPPLRVELARSSWGAELLVKRLDAISDLGKLADLSSLRALVPYPIEHHVDAGSQYLVESAISGRTGVEMAGELPVSEMVGAITGAVSRLHGATGTWITFDDRNLEHWVDVPLQRLSTAVRATPAEIEIVSDLLRDGLRGRQVEAARLHGNLTLAVTLFDPYGRLTGVLDWEWSEIGPVFIDWGSLALNALAVESRTDIGHVVGDALKDPSTFIGHPALSASPIGDLDPRVIVLSSWLHLLTPAVRAAATTPAGRFWMARNVQPVLARLPRLVASLT
jgi:aminoglycoside phosphotransferase